VGLCGTLHSLNYSIAQLILTVTEIGTCVLSVKTPVSEAQPSVLPSSSASDETASDEKTPVVQNHVKRSSDSGTDDASAKENTSKNAAAENKTQAAKKKGKGEL